MNMNQLGGIIPPTITPFTDQEELDEAVQRREVHFLMDAGVQGISFGGSTGEGALLTDEELASGIRIIKEESGTGDWPVLCGIIRNSTRQATWTWHGRFMTGCCRSGAALRAARFPAKSRRHST